jgi:MurNAc alpha-1-phosphate uridylyltransferase
VTATVVILAGGLATRLHPLTLTQPKSLIPINGYPFIGWQLKLLAEQGIDSVLLCLGHKASEIADFVGDGNQFGLNVEYSVEESQLGTGGAIKHAEHLLGDVFGVLYGDSYLPIDYLEIFDKFTQSGKLALMTVYKNSNEFDTSNVFLGLNGSLYYSKRNPSRDMLHIDYGFNVLRKEVLNLIPSNIASDLSEALEKLSRDQQIEGYEVWERFYEIGSISGIVDLENYLRRVK